MEADMRKAPERFIDFMKSNPKIAAAYENLAGECNKFGSLNERERALVKLGIAVGSGMEGSVHSQVRKGLDVGMQPAEIRHAVLLGLMAIGFPRMMAALTWAEDILKNE
jgi:alkylhydroperoxidase/carboxymuconolactone decarboxylase family protein YurZ